MSNDYGSKIDPIVLKFGTDVAFTYRQVEFVVRQNRFITIKDILDN